MSVDEFSRCLELSDACYRSGFQHLSAPISRLPGLILLRLRFVSSFDHRDDLRETTLSAHRGLGENRFGCLKPGHDFGQDDVGHGIERGRLFRPAEVVEAEISYDTKREFRQTK